jgi:hypothetical protein
MKINILYIILLLFFSYFFTKCSEIFEEDISDEEIVIIAPSDGVETTIINQLFMWETIEGANYYNLRIVTPSFQSIQKLVLDTNISAIDTVYNSDNKFYYTLNPGTYEWRLVAANSSNEITSEIMQLTILETTDMSEYNVELTSPSGIMNQTSNIQFGWESIPDAEYYTFIIRKGDWSGDSIVIQEENLTNTQYTVDHLGNGSYAWGVEAGRDSTSTGFTTNSITIDSIKPATPTLVSPQDTTFNDSSVTFIWERSDDNGTEISDVLFLYSDSEFNDIFDSVTIHSMTQHDFIFDTAQTFYWRVRSVDEAGNRSDFSDGFQFTVFF